MNSAAKVHVNRVWRRKWLILAITVLAVVLGVLSTRDARPMYTSRVAMTIGSPNRAPDQDAVLSVGYAEYFTDPAYQSKLRAAVGVPSGVRLAARTVASSPILYIESTATTPPDAQDAATKAGAAFRDEINARLRAAQDAAIAAVRKPFDDIRAANGVVSDVALTQMQDRINQINADTSNKLIDLQLDSDVMRKKPSRLPTIAAYGLAGLLFGGLVALVLGAVSRRLRTAEDVEVKIGVPVIAVVPDESNSRATRDTAMRQVVTAVGLASPGANAAVAITSPGPTSGVETVARIVAEERARQGIRTILVHADLRHRQGVGVGELLAGHANIDTVLTATSLPNLREVFPGTTGEDPFTAISRERFARLLTLLLDRADFVVVSVPPVLEAVEVQVVAAAAGSTVLVFDRATTKVADARRTHRILRAVDANVLGAVLIDSGDRSSADVPAPAQVDPAGDPTFTAAGAIE
ncbi:Wzz/FepE/Etk N-terminal domain-containing protein [Nocardia sp. NPDC051570]|uniref:Wzz/FepE/Etk N-terminal domain-containing protein n=1 Tax=Nocardia sp. NPDC051570 TaxID=3364324 RepID=UPI00379A3FC5